ncbi:amidohydrolase family protein [Granulosicoccus sp. 3-233]
MSNSRAQSIELSLVADNESHLPGHQHLEVFKATTLHAAYSNFEEDRKGSIEVGKLADLVVLSEDPLTVDPTTIKDVMVEQTILGGETGRYGSQTGRCRRLLPDIANSFPAPHEHRRWGQRSELTDGEL